MSLAKLNWWPGSVLMGIAVLTLGCKTAWASPTYLTCQRTGGYPISIYLTVDYGDNTVVTSEHNVITPIADNQGHTAVPAQVTQSRIDWQLDKRHFSLNRLTGSLDDYNSGIDVSASWLCQVGGKPTQKF
jgi:hypothetical protein